MSKQNLWEDIKKSLKEGVDFAINKTEEYTKVGKVKLDILGIKRRIERAFTELGGVSYHHTTSKKKTVLTNTKVFKEIVQKINELKVELEAKEKELDKIKSEFNIADEPEVTFEEPITEVNVEDVEFEETVEEKPKKKAAPKRKPAAKKTTTTKKTTVKKTETSEPKSTESQEE